MFKTLKELSKYTKKHRWLAFLGTITTLLFAGLALVDPHITGQIIDHLLQGRGSSYILKGLAIIMAVTVFRTLLRYVFFMSFEQYSQEIVYELRLDLYRKLQSLDFTFFDKTANGKIMSKMTGDVDAIRHFYAWITHVTIFHASIFTFALVSMFLLNPILTLLMLVIIPFILFLSLGLSKSVKPSFVKIREQFTKLNSVVQENISGNRVVRAFAREPYEIEKFEKENQAYMDRNIDSAKVWRKYLPALDAFAVMFNVVVILVGGIFVIQDNMSIGELVAFDRLLWMINNPLRMLGWMINGAQNYVASYEKVKEMLQEESAIREKNKPIIRERIKGNIRFENVSFHYEDLPVLKNLTFEVKSGQTVAILGATGSGKSTLISLLSRFYDVTEGKIYIDQLPIKEYDLQSLRSNISLAMQDIFLFSDTIESNIAYGNPNIPKEQIEKASRIAGVKEFISQFEDGYETVIGERGVGLSGGQRQRIALARAIIEDPSILVLDDTTSAVDMETEYEILNELKKINQDRTTFIIAHRISSVKDADLILVLNQGQIIERGSHEELIRQRGYYYEVFSQQMGEFDDRIAEVNYGF